MFWIQITLCDHFLFRMIMICFKWWWSSWDWKPSISYRFWSLLRINELNECFHLMSLDILTSTRLPLKLMDSMDMDCRLLWCDWRLRCVLEFRSPGLYMTLCFFGVCVCVLLSFFIFFFFSSSINLFNSTANQKCPTSTSPYLQFF